METKNLVFAPLIRVSTERQEKQGESLNTQRKQLETAINSLGGSVYQWYAGQEHATPDQERKILEQLMKDAQQKKFHAIMVVDSSRWSRDNLRNAQHLAELKKSGIRFFVGTQEYDLNNHLHELFLTVGVAFNQFSAQEHAQKSIINRIKRAERGCPSCGKKPYGRVFDKRIERWEVDEEAKRKVVEIARLYLEEDIQLSEIGKRFDMNASNLHRILTKRCGGTWEQHFRSKGCGINVIVTTPIPHLLPEDVIQRVRAKCEARRTWDHATQKHPYLLSRVIFDKTTGYALTGTANHSGQRYYRPYRGKGYLYMINADVIEQALIESLFEALSSDRAIIRAVFSGKDVDNVAEDLRGKKSLCEKELTSVGKRLANLMKTIEALDADEVGSFVKNVEGKIKDWEEQRVRLQRQIESLEDRLSSLPTKKEVIDRREWIHQQLRMRITESYFRSGYVMRDLPFDDKQRLVKLIFGGTDDDGKRYGIYLECVGGRPKKFTFEAYGRLGNLEGCIMNNRGSISSFVNGEMAGDKNMGVAENIGQVIVNSSAGDYIKECILSKRHAHYGLCLHQR